VSIREAIVALLAGLAVTVQVLCCLGMVVVRSPFDRLHFASAATTVAPPLLALAFLVDESVSSNTLTAFVVVVLFAVFGPVLVHGTARLALEEQRGPGAFEEGSGEDPT
jgi:multisubunit Na+/H+ antiporter MnhG subunit